MSRGKKLVWWGVLLLFLAACLYIAWKVPYTHDDWDWGLPVGLERLKSASLNSRYAGTVMVLAMTRSQLFKTLTLGGGMFLIPFLAARLAAEDRRQEWAVLTAAGGAALFSMPMLSWQQTFGWVSAFANFGVGAAVLLGILLLWQRSFSPKVRWPVLLAAALFFLCLIGQLFAENQTLALLGAGVVTGGYALVTRKARLPALAGMAGGLLGGILMFGNPLYGQLASSGTAVEGVRHLVFEPGQGPGEILAAILERCFTVVLPSLFESFPGVCLLASVGCLWRLWRGRAKWYWLVPAAVWSLLYSVQCWVVMEQLRQLDTWQCPWQPLRVAGAVIQLLLLLSVIVWEGGERRNARLLLLLAAVGMLAPFALVEDHGARCTFSSAVALLVLGLSLAEGMGTRRWFQVLALLALVVSVGFHVQAYHRIGQAERIRQGQMAQAVASGASSVVLPTEGWDLSYSWLRNPQSELRIGYFRAFYHLPENMEVVFLPPGSAELWPDIPETMWQNALRLS